MQNAEDLSRHPDYVAAVIGIGQENLPYNGNKRQPRSETTWSANRLDKFETAGKPVTDYTTKACVTDDFYARANAMGYVPYATRPRRAKDHPRARAGLG